MTQQNSVPAIPGDEPRMATTLCVHDADAAIALYTRLFDARTRMVMRDAAGNVLHAQLDVGDSLLLVSDEFPSRGMLGPHSIGGTPCGLTVYVSDVDAVFAAAVESGCEPVRDVREEFYGDRLGKFTDPFGHRWSVASRVRDVTLEEIAEKAAGMGASATFGGAANEHVAAGGAGQ